MGVTDVFIADAAERETGLAAILNEFDTSEFTGAAVALKANYNSADPYPASTHIDTLRVIAETILSENPRSVTLAERSGMGNTRDILQDRGVIALSQQAGFSVTVLDEIDRGGWQEIQSPGLHWSRGFFLPKIVTRADRVIQTCCLKTHRYGGHFTMSLKNSVGLVAKMVPGIVYDFMHELHTSPHQRKMIAEINRFYRTDLVVMDAADGFATGGPDKGKIVRPGVIVAGTDRVAVDAVGIALLRGTGSTREVMEGRIFGLDQIARAAEIGVGIGSAKEIRLMPLDSRSEEVASQVRDRLDTEG
ncbi:MAG: hypothetical protein A4E35_00010 [Methanoregula sp. PtaU1.Bin051]|nr:MAG: hypothetical protein A4E35_00010 [Methanoregula sp. PtaU1.Bin051]